MSRPANTSRKILVVDDEDSVRDAVRLLLEFEGHQVVQASSGVEALRLIDQAHFDIVFTDYLMPGLKGDELAAAIQTRRPNLAVVLITAYSEMLPGPTPWAAAVLSKPFVLEDLRRVLARVLPSAQFS